MELKLGSIPIRIQAWFLFMALILGMSEGNPAKLGVWVAVVVVSVVIHELGHALVGKAFGLAPRIDLHGMGGTTSWSEESLDKVKLTAPKNVAISLAGPFAGFFFAFLVFVAQVAGLRPAHPIAKYAVETLFFVNVGWGIFNLLPMLPLDGGNVLRAVLVAIAPKNGFKAARVVSIVIAAGLAFLAIRSRQWWILYLGVLFAFRNVQSLRAEGQLVVDEGIAGSITQASRALSEARPREAIALLAPRVDDQSVSPELRHVAVRLYVTALVQVGNWADATTAIERGHEAITLDDLEQYVAKMRELGRNEDADRILAVTSKSPAALTAFRA